MTTKTPIKIQSPKPELRVAGDFDFRYLAEILFRRKRIFLVPLILTPVLSLVISLLIKPSYMSTTTILLGKEDILNPLVRYETAVAMTDYNRLGSFQKIIYSRPLIEDAIHKLGLDKGLKTDLQIESLVNDIRANIHVIGLAADSFQVGCSAPNPIMAKNLVDTISRLFIDKSLQGSRREAMAAVSFIQKELDHYREELERMEGALQEFRQTNAETLQQLVGLGGQLHDYVTKELDAELELKQEQLNEKLLKERLAGEKPMVVAQALFVQNTPYQRQYQELALRMGNLLATRDKTHPEVQKLQREMDYIKALLENEKQKNEASETQEVRSPVYQEVSARLEDTRIKIKVVEQKVSEFKRMAEATRLKLLSVPQLEREQTRMEGEVKLTREISDNLRMKLEQARVSREVEIEQQANRFTIIDPPMVPLARYKPIRKNFIVAGVAGGFCLGFLVVFMLEFADPRLVRPGDLTRRLRVPLIGALPKLYREKVPLVLPPWLEAAWNRVLVVTEQPRWRWSQRAGRMIKAGMGVAFRARRFELPWTMSSDFLVSAERMRQAALSSDPCEVALDDFIERVRHIGLNIRAAYEPPTPLVLMVASATPGEGKTLMTANLGVVLASDYRQPVLLVDANLHKPDLSAMFQAAGAPGLGEVLDGRAKLERSIIATATPNLSLLPAGKTTDYGEVLFNSAAFGRLLNQVREQFSVVLIEVPGLMSHSDGLVIAPQTDGVLLVSRLYGTKLKVVEAAIQKLKSEKIVGLIVNYTEYWIPEWLYRWV